MSSTKPLVAVFWDSRARSSVAIKKRNRIGTSVKPYGILV